MKEVRIYINGKTKTISYTSEEDIKTLVKKEKENVYVIKKTRGRKKKEEPFTISKLIYKNNKFDKTEEKYITEIKLDSKNIYLFEIGLFIDIYNNIFKKLENKDLKYRTLVKLINDKEKLLHNKNSVKKEVRRYGEYHKNKLFEGYKFFENTIYYKLEMLIIADNINYYYENKLDFKDIKTILYGTDYEAKIHLDYIKDIERNREASKQLNETKKQLKKVSIEKDNTEKELNKILIEKEEAEKELEETKKQLKLHADLLPILKKESIHTDEYYIKNMSFEELKISIENINMLISSSKELNYINYYTIKKYILCLYYIFEREEINNLFGNIYLDKNIIYYDLHFYYFIFIIYTLNNKNKLDNKEYEEIINLYIEKYNTLKKEKSYLFDKAYNLDIAKRYELKNLNHNNYLKNDSYLHLMYKYNDYRDLFFEKDYYNFVLFLCSKIKFGIYFNLADYQENIFINEYKEMNLQKSDNTINNIIIQIEGTKIARKIAERFYFLKLITLEEYGIINTLLNDLLIELAYSHTQTIKNYIKDEKRILKSYDNIFNSIIDFYDSMKTDKLLSPVDYYFSKKIIKEQKIIDDYTSNFSLDESEIIEEAKKRFINGNEENISDDNLDIFTKKMFDELDNDFNGYNDRYKRDFKLKIEAFFKMNHSMIMMITKYFYKDNIKENFIKNIEYLYKLQSYTSYLVHNKMIDYNNIFIYTYHYVFMFNDIELAKVFFSSVE
ncbi:hypothetical protein [uncultured Brachyspira sp.]|uniref:hypothetical protein n=1 Tax=uncultured Brachyspira sp. TaxID=221953 RepID=UPI00260A3BF4|nr:hypothetical protein [uncultured Brachyspira sp.]